MNATLLYNNLQAAGEALALQEQELKVSRKLHTNEVADFALRRLKRLQDAGLAVIGKAFGIPLQCRPLIQAQARELGITWLGWELKSVVLEEERIRITATLGEKSTVFTFQRGVLALSDRDMAKQVRAATRSHKEDEARKKLIEAEKKAARTLEEHRLKLEKLRKELTASERALAKLEKAASPTPAAPGASAQSTATV
jgi:hypothetical protein